MGGKLIIEEPALAEVAGIALIDEGALERAVTGVAALGDKRYDPRRDDFEIQVSALGAATDVTIEGLGPAGLYESIATGAVVDGTVYVVGPSKFYRQLRFTFTGAPDGNGRIAFWATPKYNGLL